MVSSEILHPADLSAEDSAVWRGLAQANPAFHNPLLGPDFAQAVGAVRPDARVAVFREEDQAIGFLPFQRRPGGAAKPIGAPLGDYQALVCGPDFPLELAEALKLAGLVAFKAGGWIGAEDLSDSLAKTPAYAVRLDRPAQDYLEAIRARSAKRFKNWRRLDHALEREVGEVTLRVGDIDAASFETMLTWKRDQLARSNGYDFLRSDWTSALMRNLFERRSGDFRGLMISLYAGETLAAVHFGVRLGDYFHPWIASANPELASYSPGQIFLWRAIGAMPTAGLTVYDMGPSHDHYKRHYCLDAPIEVGVGLIQAHSTGGALAGLGEAAWVLAGAEGEGFAARLRRRLDIIDSVETTLPGRMRGLAEAVLMQARRKPIPDYA
ncbi:MAG: family N-acetyltransferase [Caulobacteraceae bacterium]|nr:family N-acetyltransferase [Caulobacteraceae bacterium]